MTILYVTDKKDKNLKKYILKFIVKLSILILILILGRISTNEVIKILAYVLALIDIMPFIYVEIINICVVTSNIRTQKRKDRTRYFPISISKDDLILWVSKARISDKIIVTDEIENKYVIELVFTYENGKIVNRDICINDNEVSEAKAIETIKTLVNPKIVWYTDNNNPKLFNKVILSIKNTEKK